MLATLTKNNLIPSSEDNFPALAEVYSIYYNQIITSACDL